MDLETSRYMQKLLKKYVILDRKQYHPEINTAHAPPQWIPTTERDEMECSFYAAMRAAGVYDQKQPIKHTAAWTESSDEDLALDTEALLDAVENAVSTAISSSQRIAAKSVASHPTVASSMFNMPAVAQVTIVPVAPPDFSGSGHRVSEDAAKFLHALERYANEASRHKADLPASHVLGRARVWYKHVRDEPGGPVQWKDLKQRFKLEFCGTRIMTPDQKYYEARYNKGDKCYWFIWKVVALGNKANIQGMDTKSSIESWINRLPDYVARESKKSLHTFRTMNDLAIYLETNTDSFDQGWKKGSSPPHVAVIGNVVSNVNEEAPHVAAITKPFCEHKGHPPENCYKQTFCEVCKHYGHPVSRCRAKCHVCDIVHEKGTSCKIVEWVKNNIDMVPEQIRMSQLDFGLTH